MRRVGDDPAKAVARRRIARSGTEDREVVRNDMPGALNQIGATPSPETLKAVKPQEGKVRRRGGVRP